MERPRLFYNIIIFLVQLPILPLNLVIYATIAIQMDNNVQAYIVDELACTYGKRINSSGTNKDYEMNLSNNCIAFGPCIESLNYI